MPLRNEVVWEDWEEKNLLPWLDAHRALSWKARSRTYYEQYQVDRSVGSLRGKKYHILRKQRRIGAGSPKQVAHRNRTEARRSVGRKASLANLLSRRLAQGNREQYFQAIPRTDASHIENIESTRTKGLGPGINDSLLTIYYKLTMHHRPRYAITPPFTV